MVGRGLLALKAWALLVVGLAVHALATGLLGPPRPALPPSVTPLAIDLNSAGVQELQSLPGLGPVRAEAIVLHRIRHGPFRRFEALLEVDGIGPGVLTAIEPFLVPLSDDEAARRR